MFINGDSQNKVLLVTFLSRKVTYPVIKTNFRKRGFIMEIKNKVAHLKGLMEGMEFDATTKEGKVISEIVDILDDMADEIELIYDDVDALYEYCDELDADLGDVESELFEDDYDDYYDDDDEGFYDECGDCEAEDCSGCKLSEE